MGGGPKISFPGPSQAEEELRREEVQLLRQQRDLLSQQIREQNLLAPLIYGRAGVKPVRNEAGELTGFEEISDPTRTLRDEIEKGFLERTAAAQRGELPVNPALLRDLGEQEQTLREVMRKQLGPGYETSSAGIEALGKFGTRRSDILEASRRGDLTLAESLGIARESANEIKLQDFLNRANFASNFPFQAGSNLGPLAMNFGNAAGAYQRDRLAQFQGNMLAAQMGGNTMGQIFGGVGSLLGLGLTARTGSGGSILSRVFGMG